MKKDLVAVLKEICAEKNKQIRGISFGSKRYAQLTREFMDKTAVEIPGLKVKAFSQNENTKVVDFTFKKHNFILLLIKA